MNKSFLENKSFLISSIQLKEVKLDVDVEKELGKFYTLEVNVKANHNFANSVDSCFIYRGNEESILKVMIEELFFDEVFKLDKNEIELSQKCCDKYKNILDSLNLNFELSKDQLNLLELGELNGYKLYPHFFYYRTPEKEILCFGYKLCSTDLCITIAKNRSNYSVFVSDKCIIKSIYPPITGCDFKTLELFIEKGELPINQTLSQFKEFLELNKEIIDGRIIEDDDKPTTFKVYKKNYREKTKKLLLTFDFEVFKSTGVNLKVMLMGLLSCQFVVINKSIELENMVGQSDCLSCSCIL